MAEFNAEELYCRVADLPILDYHCHLDPKEIYEDKPFASIGDLWLSADHYKWRLMRTCGVDEKYITGDAPMREKFNKFVEVLYTALHNPIREWAQMELEKFFGITLKICPKNADLIWDLCNEKIVAEKLSPKKLMKKCNVTYVCTTDDIASSLSYHEKLSDFDIKVAPGFRTDKLFAIENNDEYQKYIAKLGELENVVIDSLSALKDVIKRRLLFFIKRGCKFSDIGIEGFPKQVSSEKEAEITFLKLFFGQEISSDDADGFKGFLYLYLGGLYKEFGIVQQWHIAVIRNANSKAYLTTGRDSGFDCIGDVILTKDVQQMLDKLNCANALPETIIYPLNPNMNYSLAALAGSFYNVHLGIAWWFNDHKRGMEETFNVLSELGHIESLVGMLTDSRSFLSYVRHDYFRKLLCEFLAENAKADDFDAALSVAKKLCYENTLKMIGG